MRNFNFLFRDFGQSENNLSRYCLLLATYMPTTCLLQLFRKALVLCMLLMIIGVGNAWGAEDDEHVYNFYDASTYAASKAAGWAIDNDNTNGFNATKGAAWLRNKCGVAPTFIFTPDYPVKQISIKVGHTSGTATTSITISVDGDEWKSWTGLNTAELTDYETDEETASEEEIEIATSFASCTSTGRGSFCVYSITLIEGSSGGGGGGCTAGVASSISAGDVVLIYYPSASKEFGGYAESGDSHWGDVHTFTTTPSGYYPFTVETGNGGSGYSFKNGSYYLAMSADGNNKLVGSATKNDASSWTVSINGSGEATITNKAYTGRVLKYNTSSPRFSSYQTSTLNTACPKIYKYCDDVTYRVTYYGNENTGGTVPIDNTEYTSAQSATVLGNTGSLVKTGYAWAGWNTKADGNGTTYTTGNTISMSGGSVSLYAKWVPTYTVTWMVNGSEARTDNNVGSGTALTPPTISPLPCGDKLAGWTDAEGGNYIHGTSTLYTGATITITANKTFYAVFADYAD